MHQEKALVSIALATYNGAKYLKEQLDSLLQQTYQPIEVVVVDDCSSDNTVAILKAYMANHPTISLYTNEQNMGVTKTFEKAITLCKGAFIALCDQDDIWMTHKIEVLVQAIGTHDAVYANSLLVNAQGNSLGKSFNSIMHLKSYYNGAPFLLSNSVPGHTILAKKAFLDTLIPFPPKMLFDLWIGFCAAGNNGIKYVDQVLVHYRQHESNTIGTKDSTNKKKKESIQAQFEFKLQELKTLATAPIKDEHTKHILQQMIGHFHRRWSFKRSVFFFKYYDDILVSKKKPTYRKKLFCVKMIFKPNF